MKLYDGLIQKLRQTRSWTQDELAMASGLNLRTIQRIEKEATASLQSMKALASAFEVNIRDLEYEESEMINELVGKDVVIEMGISMGMTGYDTVKGKITRIDPTWLEIMVKNKPVYVNLIQIKKIIPK